MDAAVTISIIVVLIAYPTVVETLTNGRSPGKRAMGLRVVRVDGGPIRLRHALTRALVGAAVEWPGLLFPPLTWAVALTTMLVSPQGRRLGDQAAGTFVIHERSPAPWGWVPSMPPQLAGWASGLDLSGLDDELALAARHYLARAAAIRPPHNGRFAYRLAQEVAEKIAQQPPPGTPHWMFLSAVLAERRRRAGARVHATRALTQRIWPGFGRARLGTVGRRRPVLGPGGQQPAAPRRREGGGLAGPLAYIRSGVEIPNRSRPRRRVRAVSAQRARRLSRTPGGALSTGQLS
nr:hypothetical protein GCM10020092_089490 [Actinoplanes digitatis]